MMAPSLFNENFDLMDYIFEDFWSRFEDREVKNLEKKLYGHRAKNLMNTDIRERDDAYELIMDLPGFSKEDISIDLNKGYLIISAKKLLDKNEADSEKEAKEGNYIRRERYSGSCSRNFYVGDDISYEDVKAKFNHGILRICIPKKDSRQIEQKKYIPIEG